MSHVRYKEGEVKNSVKILSHLVADLHTLYVKTLNHHWNIVDPRFFFLHELLEDQYEALEEETDLAAERIRMLGKKVPASLKEFSQLTKVKEVTGTLTGDEMIEDLLNTSEQLIRSIRKDIAETEGDNGTNDLLIQLLRGFEKRAWILRSHLKNV